MYASKATRILYRLNSLHLVPKELAARATHQWLSHGNSIWEGCGCKEGTGATGAWLGDSLLCGDAAGEMYFGRDILMAGKSLYRIKILQKDIDWTKFSFLHMKGGFYLGSLDEAQWSRVPPDKYEHWYEICPRCLKDTQDSEDGCVCTLPDSEEVMSREPYRG